MRKRLVHRKGSSGQFWEIRLVVTPEVTFLYTTYGTIGTPGKTSMLPCDTEAKARKEAEKRIAKQLAKGFVDEDASGASTSEPGPTSAPPATASGPAAGTATAEGILALAKARYPFYSTNGIGKDEVCLIFRWKGMDDGVKELFEAVTSLEIWDGKGRGPGSDDLAVTPFALVIPKADLPWDEGESKKDLIRDFFDGRKGRFLFLDRATPPAILALSLEGGESRPAPVELPLASWTFKACRKPKRVKSAAELTYERAEKAMNQADYAEALPLLDELIGPDSSAPRAGYVLETPDHRVEWEWLFHLRARARTSLGHHGAFDDQVRAVSIGDVAPHWQWADRAAVARHYFEQKDYPRVISLDTFFLAGTRFEHYTVKRCVALAYLATGDAEWAVNTIKAIRKHTQPTAEQLAEIREEARRLLPTPAPDGIDVFFARLDPDFAEPVVVKTRKRFPEGKPRDLVIWETVPYRNGCMIDGIGDAEVRWKLKRAARFDELPTGLTLEMSKRYPKDRTLFDDIVNMEHIKIVSPGLAEWLRSKQLTNLQLVPVSILDQEGKVVSSDYFIAHFVDPEDALDPEAAKPQYNAIDTSRIDTVKKLALDWQGLDPAVRIFRLSDYPSPLLLERDLAAEMTAENFCGPVFVELSRYER